MCLCTRCDAIPLPSHAHTGTRVHPRWPTCANAAQSQTHAHTTRWRPRSLAWGSHGSVITSGSAIGRWAAFKLKSAVWAPRAAAVSRARVGETALQPLFAVVWRLPGPLRTPVPAHSELLCHGRAGGCVRTTEWRLTRDKGGLSVAHHHGDASRRPWWCWERSSPPPHTRSVTPSRVGKRAPGDWAEGPRRYARVSVCIVGKPRRPPPPLPHLHGRPGHACFHVCYNRF